MIRVLSAAGVGLAVLVLDRRFRDWGATKGECVAVLPGDEFVADPADMATRAVTIDAPAEEVWRWLVQIGQDRGGMYSYDWIENLIGLDIHSTDELRDEWQDLQVGDGVHLTPPGWMGLRDGYVLHVARVEPGRTIVLRQQPPDTPWDAVWSFHVTPLGPRRCRLVSRSRGARAGRLAQLATELIDPITLVMTRKMLLGIKQRAERSAHSGVAA